MGLPEEALRTAGLVPVQIRQPHGGAHVETKQQQQQDLPRAQETCVEEETLLFLGIKLFQQNTHDMKAFDVTMLLNYTLAFEQQQE